MSITPAQILAINRNGSGAVDFQKEAIANEKDYLLDDGISKHDILNRKLSLKAGKLTDSLKNSDDLYNSIVKLKKTGLLKDMLKKAGVSKKYLSEMDGGVSTGPITPMGNAGIMLKNSYPTNGGLGKKNKIVEEFNYILKNEKKDIVNYINKGK